MATTHSLDDLKHYHQEALQFFASELMLLKKAIPKISDERLAKAGMLLMSGGQTGTALLQLANQTDTFTSASVMLSSHFTPASAHANPSGFFPTSSLPFTSQVSRSITAT